jgi:hypothetical protein
MIKVSSVSIKAWDIGDFGFWILDFGFWILDFGFWIFFPPTLKYQEFCFSL